MSGCISVQIADEWVEGDLVGQRVQWSTVHKTQTKMCLCSRVIQCSDANKKDCVKDVKKKKKKEFLRGKMAVTQKNASECTCRYSMNAFWQATEKCT